MATIMKNRVLSLLTWAVGLAICLFGTAAAQEDNSGQTSVRFASGVTVTFTSETDPPGRDRMTLGSVQVRGSENVVHRIFLDRDNRVYFGYDLEIELAGSDQYRLIIKPLSQPPTLMPPALGRRFGARTLNGGQTQSAELRLTDLTSIALPTYPAPQVIHDGDTLALDVLVNPHVAVKIIDLIKVTSKELPAQAQLHEGVSANGGGRAATDLTAEMIYLQVTNSHLLVNGKKIAGADGDNRSGLAGQLLWFYLTGYGRFTLSLTPREGYDFQKVGVVEGSKLSFTVGGNRFEWISTSPVVPNVADALNLWVLHDPRYQPDVGPEQGSYLMGAANDIKRVGTKNQR